MLHLSHAEETKGDNALYHKTVYGDSSIGTPGTRDNKLPGWYLSCLTDGFIEQNSAQGLNGWSSELKDAPYETKVTIDLGATKTLSSLTLHAADSKTGHYNYFPKSYTLQYSTDGKNWLDLKVVNNSQPEDYKTHEFSPTAMRYVRLWVRDMHSVNGKYAASLAEIEAGEVKGDDEVLFYVPEAIYLRPVSSSWGESTKSKFHYFIENTVTDSSGNLLSEPVVKPEITTGNGKVYFKHPDGEFKNLTIRWLDSSLLTTKSGGALLKTESGSPSDAGGMQFSISREMESPLLSASETGCVIEWTLTYRDNKDDYDKKLVAYTYVYKPNVVPMATGIRVYNKTGNHSLASHISWITGFHAMEEEAKENSSSSWDARYPAYSTASKGGYPFIPFQTETAENIDENSYNEKGVKVGSLSTMYSYFASTNTAYSYFKASQSNNTYNNRNPGDWLINTKNAIRIHRQ